MKVFVKGLNVCPQRNQKVAQYKKYLTLNGHQIVDNYKDADKVLLWTCGFRQDVFDNSIFVIEQLNNAGVDLIVGGCVPDIHPEKLAEVHKGQILPWRNDFNKINECFGDEVVTLTDIPDAYGEPSICDDIESFKKDHPSCNVTFYDMFNKLVVSEGCSFACSYCSERLMLPPYRSYPLDQVLSECRQLIDKTKKYKIALFGESLGQYGKDIGMTFPELLHIIREIDGRIQYLLNNINPYNILEFYNEFGKMLNDDYFYHISLPLQSGSDKILALMNRPYTIAKIDRLFSLFSKYNFSNFDTHIILGFPGETENDFMETCNFIRKYKPNYVLVSKCYLNNNIPAAKLPDHVDDEIVTERVHRVRTICAEIGAFCNSEGGEHMKTKFNNRINIL